MSASPNLQLPYLDANQNQKSATHNQALRMLDVLVNLGVEASSLKAPPAAPADGQRWIVAPGATGAWAGRDLNIAAWQDGAWSFFAPGRGTLAYDAAGGTLLFWTGTAWRGLAGLLALLGVTALGIGTAADTGNPLSATLNNALFNALSAGAGGSGDVRIKLNKAAAGNTASFLFQDGFSGRAEIGLAGDDNFHFRVSPDGSAFVDAMVVAAAGGAVAFAASPTAPTPAPGDNGTRLATTGFVAAAVATLVAAAPGALDTLKELADALGDDPNFAATVLAGLAAKAPLASPALTGTPSAPTPALNDTSARLATTAFVAGAIDPLAISPVTPTLDYRLTASDCLPSGQFSRLSSGYRTTSAGLLVPVAAGGLRIDHDPVTGAPLGALIEEQRTNLFSFSANLTSGVWGIVNVTVQSSAAMAPDGSSSAVLLSETSANSIHGFAIQIPGTGAVGYAGTISFWAKFAGRKVALTANGEAVAVFDLQAGTATASNASVVPSIKAYPNGWFRCSATITRASTSGDTTWYILGWSDATGLVYSGDTSKGFHAWGPQLEAGAFPTSYIPTTGAQATRIQDSLVVPVTSDWFNAAEGTLYADVTVSALPPGPGYQGVLSFDDAASSGVLGIYYANSSYRFQSGVPSYGYPEANAVAMSLTPGQRARIAAAYTASSIAISVNGSVPVSTAILGIVAGMARLRIGAWAAGYNAYGGAVRRAAYIPRALTPAQLQAMTS